MFLEEVGSCYGYKVTVAAVDMCHPRSGADYRGVFFSHVSRPVFRLASKDAEEMKKHHGESNSTSTGLSTRW